MNTTRFCNNCGKPLEVGARFCKYCGQTVTIPQQTQFQTPQQPVYHPQVEIPSTKTQLRNKRKMSIGGVLVGILLLIIALRFPLLGLLGTETSAIVTDTTQVVSSSSSKLDYNYKISYQFTIDGTNYKSSYQMNKVYNISKLPQTGSTVKVLYLEALPQVSAPANQKKALLGSITLGVIGILLCTLSAAGMIKISRRR